MEENEYTDLKLARALDIVEEGESITAESLQQVKDDAELRRQCSELLALKAAARLSDSHIDVESRLKRMHARLGLGGKRTARLRLAAIITAAAAAFVGTLFLLNRPEKTTDNDIFTAQAGNEPIVITDENGEKKTIEPQKSPTYTISVKDYQRALSNKENVEKLTVSVPNGKMAHVDLPDGSVVLLHPGSRLRFPTAFIGDKRFVILEGEAYFKVTKNPNMPFIVQADGIETTVLGTEFDIKDGTVTLINGSVRVGRPSSAQAVVITPGQQAQFIDDKFKVAATDTLPYVYWRDGYLYYDNMTIRDIMRAIGSTYNMTVRCMNSDILNQRMRFMAERDKGVDSAIDMMNRMGKVRVARKDNLILVQ